MSMFSRVIGPSSKYLDEIPYTYEARVPIFDDMEEYNSYIADTICALVGHLDDRHIYYQDVSIYEIYRDRERPLDIHYCTDRSGRWLAREELCESLKMHYINHIWFSGCTFADRDQTVSGP